MARENVNLVAKHEEKILQERIGNAVGKII
jgi:hypothetical protein